MPLLRINATPDGFTLHDSPQSAPRQIERLARGGAPVIIMIHGYTYQPAHRLRCPHETLFASHPGTGWPAELMRRRERLIAPLCIAFGWPSRGGFRAMHAQADAVSAALARLVRLLKRLSPGRPVHILTHSLGSQVALSALPRLRAHDLGRVVLLAGASHVDHANRMLESPAGRTLELINVISRENDLFDLAFERLVPGTGAIGRGIDAANALNLQLDCAGSRAGLADLGFPIGATDRRICHRSGYLRTGAMAFYAQAMLDPDRLALVRLRQALPKQPAPHGTRLWHMARPMGLPAVTLKLSLAHRVKKRIMVAFSQRGSDHEPAY